MFQPPPFSPPPKKKRKYGKTKVKLFLSFLISIPVNLPPTLAKSQVSSVRKHMKVSQEI